MGPEGAANIIFAKAIKESQNPEQMRKMMIDDYKDTFANPYVAASRGYIEAVMDPADTRGRIARALELLETKVEGRPNKKHGNIPL